MCGRFTLTVHALEDIATALAASVEPALFESYRPRYNVAPGDTHWIVRSKEGRREIVPGDWGLINHWATDPSVGFKQINARAETLAERPAFRDAYRARRCVLPADGFYEWRGPKNAREPLWFHAPDRSLLLFAGLYESWKDPATDEWRRTFTIVTTPANKLVEPIHNRMPAIVAREAIDEWLIGEHPGALLVPAPENLLLFQPASRRVNTAEHDDPDLLDENDPRAKKQLSLF
jgi:putative SOS response-associated peptidase YedK